DDSINAAGLHAVEMRHKARVIGIVSANVGQPVCERERCREMALETRPRTIEGVSAYVHDLRVRQNKPYETRITEIAKSLVCEKGPFGYPAAARGFQIRVTPRSAILGDNGGHNSRQHFLESGSEFKPAADPAILR